MMQNYLDVDIVILGAGTAGIKAYQECIKRGVKALMIHHGPKGTTCARVGCMPSKVLVHTALLIHQSAHMHAMGIAGGEHVKADIPSVLRNIRSLRDYFVGFVLKETEAMGENLIEGQARFCEPNVLEVNGRRVRAKATIIATGSTPIIPQALQKFQNSIITSDTLYELDDLPKRLGIIGVGPLGAELAQALATLGVKVTAVQHSNSLGALSDPAVVQAAASVLKQNMDVWMEAEAEVEKTTDGHLLLSANGMESEVDALFISTGRRPNLEGLGLENIGLTLENGRLEVHEQTLQAGDYPIYLAGDVNGIRPVLHEAAFEARAAVAHALGEKNDTPRLVSMGIVFTHPHIAWVGKRWEELREASINIGEYSFANQGRARIEGNNRGLMRLYAERTSGKLLGGEMIAPDAGHFVHYLALAISQGMTARELLHQPFYHPVTEEGLRSCLAAIGSGK